MSHPFFNATPSDSFTSFTAFGRADRRHPHLGAGPHGRDRHHRRAAPGGPEGERGGRGAHGGPGGPGGFDHHRGGAGHMPGGHGGRSGRGGRMFEQGAIKLLALSLVAERPCHGYDLIKFIEGLVGGEYSPSPGVIYPTLSYLVDMGWATVAEAEAGRRLYSITASGQEQLERQRAELDALLARLRGIREGAGARRSPDIERAMGNLKAVLHVRFSQAGADADLARRVAALIDEAALAIQKLEG